MLLFGQLLTAGAALSFGVEALRLREIVHKKEVCLAHDESQDKTMARSTCNGTVHTNRNAGAVTVSGTGSLGLVQALLQNTLFVWTRL